MIKKIKKMKKLFLLFLLAMPFIINAQEVYNTSLNPKEQLTEAIAKAKIENKHVWVIIGANWCKWCREFDKFAKADAKIDSISNADYVVVKLNYDKKSESCMQALKELGFPQRFGVPVFVILNSKGERIHTQNTGYLELGQGVAYDSKKVVEFLTAWNVNALLEKNYIK